MICFGMDGNSLIRCPGQPGHLRAQSVAADFSGDLLWRVVASRRPLSVPRTPSLRVASRWPGSACKRLDFRRYVETTGCAGSPCAKAWPSWSIWPKRGAPSGATSPEPCCGRKAPKRSCGRGCGACCTASSSRSATTFSQRTGRRFDGRQRLTCRSTLGSSRRPAIEASSSRPAASIGAIFSKASRPATARSSTSGLSFAVRLCGGGRSRR